MADPTMPAAFDAQEGTWPGKSRAFRRFARHRPAMISVVVLVLLVVATVVGPLFLPYPFGDTTQPAFIPPGAQHLLGTDQLGHDELAQVLRGTQFSLLIAVAVAALSTALGVAVGAVAGYFGGLVDGVLMRFVDLFLIMPPIALVAILVHAFSGGWYVVAIVLALFGWMPIARITRAEALALSTREFIYAARALGASASRIIVRHLVPNMIGTIVVNATLAVATAVLAEAGLSFIGLGVRLPDTSLGLIVKDNYPQLMPRPWLFLAPFLVIVVISLTANFIGDGLRSVFDPRQAMLGD